MKTVRYILSLVTMLLFIIPTKASDSFTIVIDAGHGGKDPGAVNGKNQEKAINLNVALKVGKLIEENCNDVRVIYTRKTDVFVPLDQRADIANKADADLFISIHTNSAKSRSAYGAETFLLGVEENRTSSNFNVAIEENKAILLENDYETHYAGYDPKSPESQIIFEFMQNEYQKESLKMATMVQNSLTGRINRFDRGVHQAGFLVLWKSFMPSILIELGFISNTEEMNYLTSQKGVNELGQSIYEAFATYLDYTREQKSKALPPEQAINTANKEIQVAQVESTDTNIVPIYKIQFMSVSTKVNINDSRLKGLQDVECVKDGNVYKYMCGATTDYEEVKKTKKQISKRFKDAFVVVTLDGKKISVQEALKIPK